MDLQYLLMIHQKLFADFSYKFLKLQDYSLAFVAGLARATDEGSLSEIAQYSPYHLPLNVYLLQTNQTIMFYLQPANVKYNVCIMH